MYVMTMKLIINWLRTSFVNCSVLWSKRNMYLSLPIRKNRVEFRTINNSEKCWNDYKCLCGVCTIMSTLMDNYV